MAYTGIYERTIFYNPVNKYSVISVKTSDRSTVFCSYCIVEMKGQFEHSPTTVRFLL